MRRDAIGARAALDLLVPDREPRRDHSFPMWLDNYANRKCQCMPCLVARRLLDLVPEWRARGLPFDVERSLLEYSDL